MRNSILYIYIFAIMLALHQEGFGATAGEINRQGVELGRNRKYREAVEEFNHSIDRYNRESAMAYHNKGWAQELMGEYQEAVRSYEEALYRNPRQVITGEKLGYLYYRLEDYANAVRVGEYVMKIDPKNKEVPKWLPDAYMKKLEQEKRLAEARKKEEKEKEEEKKKAEERKQAEEEKRKEDEILLYATMDFMIRTGYYFRGDKGYRYVGDPGSIVDIPESVYVRFTPRRKAEFSLYAANPYLGALTPNVMTHTEVLEGMYKLDKYMLGAGVMFGHYDSDISFGVNKSLWDVKVGVLFGYKKDKVEMKFSLYPRFIPHDGSASNGITYDMDKFQIDYMYKVDNIMSIYSILAMNDYYVFDHEAGLSNYWGMYELGLGLSLGKVEAMSKFLNISVAVEFHERLYFRDLNNDDPYGYLNGQGFFGMNSSKWLKGDPFSGFRSFGHELSFKVQEKLGKYFFLYQKFIVEMSDQDENHHEFNFLFGVGAVY